MDTNPQREAGRRIWHSFRHTVSQLYTLSLADPADEARFTISTRTFPMPRAILVRSQGTAHVMTRGPALVAHGADQLVVLLQREGSLAADCDGRRAHIRAGDVAILDHARPSCGEATDYANLMVVVARESVPGTLLTMEPHGLVFPHGSGAARLIGAALQELYAQAEHLTISEAEAAIEGIMTLTACCARAMAAGDEARRLKSRRKAALDYIDAHLADAQLGPAEIAAAVNLSRASLYRLLAADGGIRAMLSKRRLDKALRLVFEDQGNEHSLKAIVRCCGFAGTSQFSRAFRARFGVSARQYRARIRAQGLDRHDARLTVDGFDQEAFLCRHRQLDGSDQPQQAG